ncbi:MAG: ABC transporter permease subunit, partial [Nitrospiraceae bacterium]
MATSTRTLRLPNFRNTTWTPRRRRLREYLTGYMMILPATFLILLFGIFPVFFALYVSLHKWRIKRTDFIGLSNYTKAIDNLAFVALFALGVGALILAVVILRRVLAASKRADKSFWILAPVGALQAAAVLSLIRWFVLLLPQVLDIADKVRGLERTRELFLSLLGEAFRAETVVPAFRLTLLLLVAAVIVGWVATRIWRDPENLRFQAQFAGMWLAMVGGAFLVVYTYSQAGLAYREAIAAGENPAIWPQIITISSGVLLLVVAWFVWRSASNQDSDRAFWIRIFAAVILMIGGWVLIAELPKVIAAGDEDMWNGLVNTVFYSAGTVPFQLAIGLLLAILLFQKLAGFQVFRMVFFLPYVLPFVATAAVFKQLFSIRPQSPANQFMQAIGFESQGWVQEPAGVFAMLGAKLGFELPEWAGGPSLALVVIMIFSIWVYVGYYAIIYMAGLGNISSEVTEAAQIDGAGRWQVFRHITFPLLSPTTYFLTLIGVIGTFKAFTHIWVMRANLSLDTTYTFSVAIFLEFFEGLQYGYASALAFVLFAIILGLTVINSRIQGTRVF